MGRVLDPYPSAPFAVMRLIEVWLPDEFTAQPNEGDPGYRTGRVFPQNLQAIIAAGGHFAQVNRIGGNDDGLTDHPLVDIDNFAPTFADAERVALMIQARLLGYPWLAGATVIDKVRTAMSPHPVPWDDDNTFRFYSSYTISVRRSLTGGDPQ